MGLILNDHAQRFPLVVDDGLKVATSFFYCFLSFFVFLLIQI